MLHKRVLSRKPKLVAKVTCLQSPKMAKAASFFFRFSQSTLSAIFRAFLQSPEEFAREKIDKLLTECGWIIQDRAGMISESGTEGVQQQLG